LFEGHGFKEVNVPPDQLPGGQRRSLVECYYAGNDLKNRDHVRRLLAVFEDIFFEAPEPFEEGKRKLVRLLERDGFQYRKRGQARMALGERGPGSIGISSFFRI
jgi:hypothetical protein